LCSFQLSIYNAKIIQLQSALDDEYDNFSGNIKPVPHFRANNWKTFFKKLFPDVHFGAVSLIHPALLRNDATLRKVLAPFSFSLVIDYISFFFFLDFYGY